MADTPERLLTRHFFGSLFDFGFLSDAGAESFKRLLLGASAVAIALGLLLVRILAGKYLGLSKFGTPADYQREVIADHLFLVAVPMWVVAFAVVLVGHALFPDETDYRILMAQPVSRASVFRAKLRALLQFATLFIAGAHVALLPMFLITALNRLAPHAFVTHLVVFELASVIASAFSALAIVALHGLLVQIAPRARLVAFSTLVRSGLVCALVLSLPLLLRLPGSGRAIARGATWVPWTPASWFVGLERWLLGHRDPIAALVPYAVVGTVFAVAVVAVSYAVLYRHFDRVILRPQSPHAPPRRTSRAIRAWSRHPVRAAIRAFTSITLRRSVLHQGIVVALAAVAAGFVMNGVLGATASRRPGRQPAADVAAGLVMWAPFVLIFIAAPAIRLALSVPIELRANWIFRMTEDHDTRVDAIGAGVGTTMGLGVAVPVALLAPFQWAVLGPNAAPVAIVTLTIGWLFVEYLMQDWRRVPFTCSYMPGKGFVPQMFVRGVFGFAGFTGIGTVLTRATLEVPALAIAIAAMTGGPAIALLMRRRRTARHAPLEFEDQLPTELNPLRLSGD